MKSSLFLVLFLVGCSSAMAAEGVFQISQTCALVGCFAGDAAGFPVTIASSGSYRLTSNLDLTGAAAGADAIDISGNGHVTVDLGGFTIKGGYTCSGSPVTACTGSPASGNGIFANSGISDVTIRNGHIHGMSYGVSCIDACQIEKSLLPRTAVAEFRP